MAENDNILTPATVFVLSDEHGLPKGIQIQQAAQDDYRGFIAECVRLFGDKAKIENDTLSMFPFKDIKDVPPLKEGNNADYRARLQAAKNSDPLRKQRPVSLLDAAYCIENGIDPLSKHAHRSELEKRPEYNYYTYINKYEGRDHLKAMDSEQRAILLEIINGNNPAQKLERLPLCGEQFDVRKAQENGVRMGDGRASLYNAVDTGNGVYLFSKTHRGELAMKDCIQYHANNFFVPISDVRQLLIGEARLDRYSNPKAIDHQFELDPENRRNFDVKAKTALTDYRDIKDEHYAETFDMTPSAENWYAIRGRTGKTDAEYPQEYYDLRCLMQIADVGINPSWLAHGLYDSEGREFRYDRAFAGIAAKMWDKHSNGLTPDNDLYRTATAESQIRALEIITSIQPDFASRYVTEDIKRMQAAEINITPEILKSALAAKERTQLREPESLLLVIDSENSLKHYETRPTTENTLQDFIGERATPYMGRGTMPDDWLIHYALPDKGLVPENNYRNKTSYLVRILDDFHEKGIKQTQAISLRDGAFCRDMAIPLTEYKEKQKLILGSSHYEGFLEMVETGKYGKWNCNPEKDESGLYGHWAKCRRVVHPEPYAPKVTENGDRMTFKVKEPVKNDPAEVKLQMELLKPKTPEHKDEPKKAKGRKR